MACKGFFIYGGRDGGYFVLIVIQRLLGIGISI